MRDGHNGYGPSAGIAPAREAVARGVHARGFPVTADRVFITAGTSEGIELALSALVERRRRSARADADLSAVHGGAREARRARACTTGPIRRAAGCRISITSRASSRRRRARSSSSIRTTRPARPIRPRRGARCSTSPSGTASRSSPTRSTAISATTARSPPIGSLDPDAPIISFSSLSKAYLAPGWRTRLAGRRPVAAPRRRASRRSRSWPTAACAAPCRCSTRSPRR